jgi:hypothetical protein
MMTPDTAWRHLDLSPPERRAVEAEIWELRARAPVPVGMAPGYYHEAPFFPCAPLEQQEYNLDYRGNLTLCCQLSGYAGGTPGTDVVGSLHELSLADAVARFGQRVATYLADKRERIRQGAFGGLDHFPCWYCVNYLGKVPALAAMPHHPWTAATATAAMGDPHAHFGSETPTPSRGGGDHPRNR